MWKRFSFRTGLEWPKKIDLLGNDESKTRFKIWVVNLFWPKQISMTKVWILFKASNHSCSPSWVLNKTDIQVHFDWNPRVQNEFQGYPNIQSSLLSRSRRMYYYCSDQGNACLTGRVKSESNRWVLSNYHLVLSFIWVSFGLCNLLIEFMLKVKSVFVKINLSEKRSQG